MKMMPGSQIKERRFSMNRTMSRLLKRTSGSSIVELALVMPVLLLMLVGAVDMGRAYSTAIAVNSAAHAAALYGAQNFTDIPGMQAVAQLNAANVPSLTTAASYGCECYDSTPESCKVPANPCGTGNLLFYVLVTTNATYKPILPYPGFTTPMALSGKARMRAAY
jgi:Flp pilus assembly protein TadG